MNERLRSFMNFSPRNRARNAHSPMQQQFDYQGLAGRLLVFLVRPAGGSSQLRANDEGS